MMNWGLTISFFIGNWAYGLKSILSCVFKIQLNILFQYTKDFKYVYILPFDNKPIKSAPYFSWVRKYKLDSSIIMFDNIHACVIIMTEEVRSKYD